jgi:hypothetical protein
MPDLWLDWKSHLKVTADVDAELVVFNRLQDLVRTQMTGLQYTSGVYDLTPSDAPQLDQGDITTIQFVYLEADFDGLGYRVAGVTYTPLKQQIPNEPAIALFMTTATSLFVSAGGTTGGRLTYFLAGV